MTSLVVVHDAIHANIAHLPPGPSAGYTTGTADIRWTAADWQHHPAAIRICQDFGATDITADVLDVESGAATNTEAAAWYHAAFHSYATAARPGQRHPAIYTSASNVTSLVNALIANGVRSGPNLWVARWDRNDARANSDIANASGPFPIIGIQDDPSQPGQPYDTSVFDGAWRNAVSVLPTPTPSPAAAGPFLHHTKAGDTWAGIATARNTSIEHIVQLSAALKLPAGVPYNTTNP